VDSAHQVLDHMLVSVRERVWPNVPSVTVGAVERFQFIAATATAPDG
jgi:hypothetical protein